MKNLSFIAFLSIFSIQALSQTLFVPLEVTRAIENKTRTLTGKPGEKYWQNTSVYNIDVEIIPGTRTIRGKETIRYTNNSTDSLHEIIIRLYQDIFKKGGIRDFEIDEKDINDGVIIKSILINNKPVSLKSVSEYSRAGTNASILLSSPLLPKTTLSLAIEWEFTISQYSNIRTGTYDSTTFFVGYWYPQVAVYDDINGWDRLGYSGQQEFYNDFSDFTVHITAPSNFFVWATGMLSNGDVIFTPKVMQKLNDAAKSDSLIRIVTPDDYAQKLKFFLNDSSHVWNYSATNVTDFAFAVSDHYLWDAASVVVDSKTNRRVHVSAIYPIRNEESEYVANVASSVLKTYSEVFPQVSYPYPSMTVFINKNTSGGMEFPMMVNDGSPYTHLGTVGLTAHEIAHTYFPFYMGTNERRYAWMDEGWAVVLPFDLQKSKTGEETGKIRNAKAYEQIAGTQLDLPLVIPAFQEKGMAYRNSAYGKPACAYDFLRDMVGKEKFTNALKEYMSIWNGKHPVPYDFFNAFNAALGENFDWYWKPWFMEFGYPDLAINKIDIKKETVVVTIKKVGNIPVPVDLKIVFNDSTSIRQHYDASIWKSSDIHICTVNISKNKTIQTVELGNATTPDINKEDNKRTY